MHCPHWKDKKKIIFSQPKPIVYFAKPTETQNTFLSAEVFLQTQNVLFVQLKSLFSVFVYYQNQFFKQNQINVFV